MPAGIDDITASERDGASGTIVYTTLYDLIAAINDAIVPGEEAWVVPIATHLLRAGHARFLRDVDVEMLWEEGAPLSWCRAEAEQAARNPSADAVAGNEAPADFSAEAICTPA